MATVVLLLGAAVATVGLSPAAASHQQATSTIETVAEELRRDPVYVDGTAERALSDGDADDLRAAIRSSGEAIFVAVLPASAAGPGGADALPTELAQATGLAGTYAVVVGDSFRAASSSVPDAAGLATASFQEASSGGASAVLERFVERVASVAAGGDGSTSAAGGDTDGSSDAGSGSLLPLALLGAGGGGLWLVARRRRARVQREEAAELAADVQMLRAELAVLSDDVLRLEPVVAVNPDAQLDYEAAVQRFRAASAALDYADEPLDLIRVERVVSEARYAMARARAIVQGHEPPPPPADLQRPGRHDEPPLALDDQGVPVYVGMGPMYGGGWFGGGGGGLFSGLLLGSMLGGWGWGGGFGHDHHDGGGFFGGDGGGGFGDGGGFGGGDWGGGDVGGGDW